MPRSPQPTATALPQHRSAGRTGRGAWPLLAVLALQLAGCATTATVPDAQATLQRASQTMGLDGLHTLRFAGRGTGGTFGQAWQPGIAWPALNYSVLSRELDFDQQAFHEEFGRSRGEPNGGGATPLMGRGEAKASVYAQGNLAWNGSGAAATAAPVALDARLHDLWTSPHGVLKAVQRWGGVAGTAQEAGQTFTTLAVTVPGRLQATAIQQSQGSFPVLDLVVSQVEANPALAIEAPAQVRSFAENVVVQPVAPGVWFLAGGSHNSVAIETGSQIVLVESPLYDGRALAVFKAANALVPGKTVQTVINSHHH
ncbi:MAG: hypothetical protein CFE45_12210, partial [Burkholderiales bacterium PBB5]